MSAMLAISRPPTTSVPVKGARPVRARASVDLPDPDSPTIPRISPRTRSKETSRAPAVQELKSDTPRPRRAESLPEELRPAVSDRQPADFDQALFGRCYCGGH